jgi:hypothetical protein
MIKAATLQQVAPVSAKTRTLIDFQQLKMMPRNAAKRLVAQD